MLQNKNLDFFVTIMNSEPTSIDSYSQSLTKAFMKTQKNLHSGESPMRQLLRFSLNLATNFFAESLDSFADKDITMTNDNNIASA
jgi:hypothetical protein